MLDWQKVGSFYYRTRDIYSLPRNLGRSEVIDAKKLLNNPEHIVSLCPFGGPVAVMDNSNRLYIFTPSFRIISELTLAIKSDVVGMYWWLDPQVVLTIITADATIVSITVEPGTCTISERKLKLPSKSSSRLVAAAIHRSAFPRMQSCVVLSDSGKFFQIDSDSASALPALPTQSPVVCFAVVAGRLLVSQECGSLVLIDPFTKSTSVLIEGSNEPSLQVLLLEVAVSGNFIAAFTASGAVTVYSATDLIDSGILKPVESSLIDIGVTPSHIAWVGDDCLCISFSQGSRNVLFLGGVGGSWSPYEHESLIHISSDLLCGSVLTASRYQTIQRVSTPTFNLASNSGSAEARLLLGFEKHSNNDLQAEPIIRSIKDQLDKAVVALAEAAAFETPVPQHQTGETKNHVQTMLKASIFGRQFCTASTVVGANLFVNAASLIRVCAALNEPGIGIPVSVPQLMQLGPRDLAGSVLVNMLASRGLFLLGLRVAKWLGVSPAIVLDQWACALIASSDHIPDRDLCDTICERVPANHSLARVARHAFKEMGRKNLAILLLQRESNVGEQVQLLLDLDSEDLALQKALAADDVDATHTCFDSLIASQKSFQELVTTKSSSLTNAQVALMMSLVQARYYGEHKYEDLCKLLQLIPGSELLLADSALELAQSRYTASIGTGIAKSEEAADWVQYAAERFAECVVAPSVVSVNPGQLVTNSPQGCQTTASLLADTAQLVRAQVQLEKTAAAKGWPRGPHKFAGLSLDETLKRLVLINEISEAENLRIKRKVSDGKWWELRVRVLLQTPGRLEEGIGFVNKVPPPSSECRGYKVVVETLLGMKREDLALPFIKKLKTKKQVEILNQLGLHEEARLAENQRTSVVPGAALFGKLASGLMGSRS